MNLDEAYEITEKMTMQDHKNPTNKIREAKQVIYEKAIKPKYGEDNPMLEPDFNEGWK